MKRDEAGQALVEMALVLPLFLILIFAVSEMAIVGYDYLSVQNSASAGANMAVIGGNDSQVTQAITNAAPGLDPSTLSVVITPPYTQRYSGQPVSITVSYPVKLILPVIPGIPNPLTVSANLTMQVQ